MSGDAEYRSKWAFWLTASLTILIFLSFAIYKGMFGFNRAASLASEKSAEEIVVKAPSPIENSKQTFGSAFKEIKGQYDLFKESIAGVLVPFVTGIDVYERK